MREHGHDQAAAHSGDGLSVIADTEQDRRSIDLGPALQSFS